MFFVVWVIIGVLAGLTVNKVAERQRSALSGDLIMGVVGAVVGGFVFNVLFARGATDFNLWNVPCAGMGALLMLGGFHGLRRVGHGFL